VPLIPVAAPSRPTIRIRGEGVGAAVCAKLLTESAIGALSVDPAGSSPRRRIPAIMIGSATQHLMSDVLGRPDLFSGFTQIRKRVVLWGSDSAASQAVTLPHSAIVTSEQALQERLHSASGIAGSENGPAEILILASARPVVSEDVEELRLGSRTAAAARVRFGTTTPGDTCWVEAVSSGWLFMLPDAQSGSGWLLGAGAELSLLVRESRLVAEQIAEVDVSAQDAGQRFPAYPRLSLPLCSAVDKWFACGAGAMAFDPLCGDGTGNATREAILAAAAVEAVVTGRIPARVVADHYQNRLLLGFKRHLAYCREFYRTGGRSHWWQQELAALEPGITRIEEMLGPNPAFHLRLNGNLLERV
jgi:hypothetical protein